MNKLVEARAITPDGRDWLTCALDPYHDFNHNLAGYPDASVSQTLVSMHQYQMTLTAPAGVAGDWDAHIYTLPIAYPGNFDVGSLSSNWIKFTLTNPAQLVPLGPLNVASGPAGSATLFPTSPQPANHAYTCLPAAGNEELSSGCSRVIAMGFEVHNTTAEIYKQGSVCTYRMPCAPGRNHVVVSSNDQTVQYSVSGVKIPQPPPNQTEAMRLKTARTWEARDGCYATCFQSSVENPLVQMSCQNILIGKDADPGVTSTALSSYGSSVVNNVGAPTASKLLPYDVTGAFFCGLSQQTSLVVKLRVYVERAPGWVQPELAPLASPSAGYDIHALELYAQAINALPAAVKVNENAAGDWWRAVLGVIKHVAGPVGTMLNGFLPGAANVGKTVQKLAGQLNPRRSISQQVVERLPEASSEKSQPRGPARAGRNKPARQAPR